MIYNNNVMENLVVFDLVVYSKTLKIEWMKCNLTYFFNLLHLGRHLKY